LSSGYYLFGGVHEGSVQQLKQSEKVTRRGTETEVEAEALGFILLAWMMDI